MHTVVNISRSFNDTSNPSMNQIQAYSVCTHYKHSIMYGWVALKKMMKKNFNILLSFGTSINFHKAGDGAQGIDACP